MTRVDGYGELFRVAAEVGDALADGRPVVALESTLITHGLPRPRNGETARRAEAAVRAAGAVPATVAVRDGSIRVGLTSDELDALADAREVPKASRQNLSAVLGRGGWAGTTVAATMIAARAAGIGCFATGGIGGVHRGGERTLDISADLQELARTPVVVVCSGPKSILDVALTLEYLETHGVPVLGWRADELAGFLSRSSGHPVQVRVDEAHEVAAMARRHWALGLDTGLVVAVPLDEHVALPRDGLEAAIGEAIAESERAGIRGSRWTPFVLSRVAELTGGCSTDANVALIEANAGVAAVIAIALAQRSRA